jgi:hypothetical protein
MNKDQKSPKRTVRTLVLYGASTAIVLLLLGFFIETCESEKIRICDDATGECTLESSCRPLVYSLF